tara:strand:+ start:146 stop:703 length:558 start_codon:yes stop_codon:yes gene_type:complete
MENQSKDILVYYKTASDGTLPVRAHKHDAGYDIFASSDPTIVGETFEHDGKTYYSSIDYIQYGTGLRLQPFDDKELLQFDLRPRSSISSKTWLTMCNTPATIDHGYRGEIFVRFRYNVQPSDMSILIMPDDKWGFGVDVNPDRIYNKGQAIGQLLPDYVKNFIWIKKEELSKSERDEGGFGSTHN